MSAALELAGRRFAHLTVMALLPERTARKERKWLCICDCGKVTKVIAAHLKSGNTTSCGHAQRATVFKHGLAHSPEYSNWRSMLCRCYVPKKKEFRSYGGRGIGVCDRWRYSFENFYSDMGSRPSPKHQLDRIDVDGNYEPRNCRWVLPKVNARNKRHTMYVTHQNQSKPLAEWCELLNIPRDTVQHRIKIGWAVERAFSALIRKKLPNGMGRVRARHI